MTGIPMTNVSVNAGSVNVYVDGSCVGKGSDSAAGFGVWFGPYHELNFNWMVTDSDCSSGHDGSHKQNSQKAEIQAATSAIQIAHREKIFCLRIHSDSHHVLDGITKNEIGKWKQNGWLTCKGRPLVNKGDWINLDKTICMYESCGGILEWKYVKAHSGNIGNENADRLAKWAAVASYDFLKFFTSSKCPHGCCGCAGPNASDAEKRKIARLTRKMLASRKKTSLQFIHENKEIILP